MKPLELQNYPDPKKYEYYMLRSKLNKILQQELLREAITDDDDFDDIDDFDNIDDFED